MSVKPVAWMTPKIINIHGAYRHSVSRELVGEVAWHPTLIGDSAPVTDKHGVTHSPKPLYDASAPELAEALQALLDASDCPQYNAAKDEAISLLARITPK